METTEMLDSFDVSQTGVDMVFPNTFLQRRRSSLRLGRRRPSFLELFKGITTDGDSAAMNKRRSSFSILMDSLFTDHESGGMMSIASNAGIVPDVLDMVAAECSQHSDAMPLTPAASPVPESTSNRANGEEILYSDLDASHKTLELQKKIRAIVKVETPPPKSGSRAGPAASTTKAKAGKKRAKPQSEAVRALMPAAVKRGRRNPMLEAATVGMSPEVARLEKNRLSARECRIRKKAYLQNLESTVAVYAEKEKEYLAEIAALRAQVKQLQQA